MLGEDLYKLLSSQLDGYLHGARQRLQTSSNENLVQLYIDQWNHYVSAATNINHICGYLNRHWVMREVDEGRKGVYDVYTLYLLSWYEKIYCDIKDDLIEGVVKLVEKRRGGESIEHGPTATVIDFFAALGLEQADENEAKPVDVYHSLFEQPFIDAAAAYDQPITWATPNHDLADLLKKLISGLGEEHRLALRYLRPGAHLHQDTTDFTDATVKLSTNDNAVIEVGTQRPL